MRGLDARRFTLYPSGMATIMIVEDNLIYRELLCELCEMEGFDVIDAARAEEALALLANYQGLDVRRQRRSIDLFITDFNMDGMNGFEFLREVRRYDALRHVPVLMISSTSKNMRDLMAIEGVSFLAKPCSNATVMDHVRRLLGDSAPRRAQEFASEAQVQEVFAAEAPAAPEAPSQAEAEAVASEAGPAALSPESDATLPPFLGSGSFPVLPAEPAAPPPFAPARRDLRSAPPARRQSPPPPPPPAAPAGPSLPQARAPLPPAPPPAAPPAPPTSVPPAPPSNVPPAAPRDRTAKYGQMDDGIRNHIADSSGLSDYLTSRRRPATPNEASASEASSPVAELFQKILDGAMRKDASDIHIEPYEAVLEVRARVDGALQSLVRLPASVAENLIARIKIVSNLNITEKRLPQDGQFFWRSPSGKAAKFRVSTLPSVHGEKVVIRILPSESLKAKLNSIGLSNEEHSLVRRILSSPNGLILVTGPTGSGKTTTLYTMLDSLNTPQRNIVTVEDPVEYQLPGITQVQVNSAIGFTFERVLRSFLRQDPDVMLVGEIRDAETGEIALKAAVTGRIVLSTLHTNDAAAAVHRMIGMGLSPHLVAAATRLIIAQRLVRKLCPACRVPSTPSSEETMAFEGEGAKTPNHVWRARGCPACHGSGYSGRRPVFEILPILSHETRTLVAKGAPPEEIRASAAGMQTLRRKALQLVADGSTSPEEALSVLYCL